MLDIKVNTLPLTMSIALKVLSLFTEGWTTDH
jgi:hypothetical protein